ncbi:endonuclease/exonuclease/phosphatase family protein [Actinomadura violacea]|uniref:Endonuclease/exonuclease/phosphatase domain-containing protein n=1 Tax=Actinomadura violacea TaxID=2819934 RepID=A0ABS3RXN4_9ACTN|nr:endonuclease/exonuclease/phosphatase family protein [Actinomadura violacea]MBO2461518.1 hypothetical protein [Actinomadura violacea]
MTRLRIDYINYEHGGRVAADGIGYANDLISLSGTCWDFTGLVRIMSTGSYPAVLVLGEGDYYRFSGAAAAWGAANALRAAGGPTYTPLIGSLPRQWGPFAPVVFVDLQRIVVHRWYDDTAPDFAARTRNMLVGSLPGRTEEFRIVAVHGDIFSGQQRLADARELQRLAATEIPCAIAGDFNTTLSGPDWEPGDLNDTAIYPPEQPWRPAWRTRWSPALAGAEENVPDADALDYLCGIWRPGRPGEPGRRVGGVGFYDAAELAGDTSPTQLPRPDGRQACAIDHILLNKPFADRLASYQVHQPADPDHPDSDHLRISVELDV